MSDSNRRVVELLNFLAAHPTQSFNLSELASRLALSYGSAHRVLSTLTEAGYLTRHPKHKTYSLGLALAAIGQATLERHPVVAIAQREMTRLAEELGVQCIASAVTGRHMLFIAKAGSSTTAEGVIKTGEQRPLMPPLGLGHIAWAKQPEINAYLDRAGPELSAQRRQFLNNAMAVVRERGYAMSVLEAGMLALAEAIRQHHDEQHQPDYWAQMAKQVAPLSNDEMQLLALEDLAGRRLSHISAPIFNSDGEVLFELSLSGLPPGLTHVQATTIIERLLAVTAVITSESHGRKPR
ncbi:IclR family transcriptional regulator [Halioxenophilus sp. WMMB6]|uniref:IclR family transcriptional regulator n=1 Tax=Halioxenophilus sp. WMMB6 TaxID=3073815 RepID=UPI00295ED842|nr:helix-turn-helix domain-containing protein [Halioxenophilus sp. WMMB6]